MIHVYVFLSKKVRPKVSAMICSHFYFVGSDATCMCNCTCEVLLELQFVLELSDSLLL